MQTYSPCHKNSNLLDLFHMKKDIHPKYHQKAKVICACGNTFEVGSTQAELKIEICSACHPFYTGKQKFVDTARRVEKFKEKQAKVSSLKQQGKKTIGKKKRRALRTKAKTKTRTTKKGK